MKGLLGIDVTPSTAHGVSGLPGWQHDDASIAFFRITESGRVHVRGRYENAEVFGVTEHQASANLYLGRVVALCGKKTRWFIADYLSHFPDELLCMGCHRNFPADTNLLFEHDQG